MKRFIAIAMLVLLILVLLSPLVLSLATAEDRRDEEREDEEQQHEEEQDQREQEERGSPPPAPRDGDEPRALSFTTTNSSVTVVSSGKTDGRANSFYFTVEEKDGLILHYNYFRESASEELAGLHQQFIENRSFENGEDALGAGSGPSSPQDLGLSLKFTKLYEFDRLENSSSHYDLSDASYKAPQVQIQGPEDAPINIDIQLGTSDDVFGLSIHISSSYISDAHGIVGPLEIEFAITIQDYPITDNASHLVLESSLDTPGTPMDFFTRKLVQESGDGEEDQYFEEEGLGSEKNDGAFFLSWSGKPSVDGQEQDVNGAYSRIQESNGRLTETVSFFYPAGLEIHHEQKLGAADLVEAGTDSGTQTTELLLTWSTGLVAGIATIFVLGVKLSKPAKYHWEEDEGGV